MRLAILKNNIVENVVVADLDFAEKMDWDFIELDENIPCDIGWIYEDETFKAPSVLENENVNIIDTHKDEEFISPPEILVPNDEALAE